MQRNTGSFSPVRFTIGRGRRPTPYSTLVSSSQQTMPTRPVARRPTAPASSFQIVPSVRRNRIAMDLAKFRSALKLKDGVLNKKKVQLTDKIELNKFFNPKNYRDGQDVRIMAGAFNELLREGGYLLFEIRPGFYRVITKTGIHRLDDIKNGHNISDIFQHVELEEQTKSDGTTVLEEIITAHNPKVQYVRPSRTAPQGGFFVYTHNTDLDLSRYQIYKTGEIPDRIPNCFYHAMMVWNADAPKDLKFTVEELNRLEDIKFYGNIKTTDLNRGSKKKGPSGLLVDLDICLSISKPDKNEVRETKKKNLKGRRKIKVGLILSHFFILDEGDEGRRIPITKHALKYCTRDEKTNEFSLDLSLDVFGKRRRYLYIYTVIKMMLERKDVFLEDFKTPTSDPFKEDPNYNGIDAIQSLEYDEEKCCKEVGSKGHPSYYSHICYADFETCHDDDGYHHAYLCALIIDDGEPVVFRGEDCGKQLIAAIPDGSLVYFHNLGYDYRFFMKFGTFKTGIIKSFTKVINLVFLSYCGMPYGKKPKEITFHDSLAIITKPLRDFGKCFPDLPCEKEVMPYDIYHIKNCFDDPEYPLIEEAKEKVKENDREQFLGNIEKWGLELPDGRYDHITYSAKYCEIDVKVLAGGVKNFRDQMLTVTGLDMYQYLSLPSIADTYLLKQGCYDGCYSISGLPREFIQRCQVGGRTMMNSNERWHIEGEEIADFDGVSLYPSAMYEMSGFLMGKPKVITEDLLDYDKLKHMNGYFVEIEVEKVGKYLEFPLLSYVADGKRNFSNDMAGRRVSLDKITLEDVIKYQKIDFKIIRGYYFNDGFNTQIKETIKFLFEERLKKKAEENPIQEIYKLLMNSSYGKNGLKPFGTERIFKKGDKYEAFLQNNYHRISTIREVSDGYYYLECHKFPSNHFNRVHISTEILSWSKRIMNRVFHAADEAGAKIYYQDTDSMHIQNHMIDKVAAKYKKLYERDLIGKYLGQFHTDFANKSDKNYPPVAVEHICVAKKVYIDKIRVVNNGVTSYEHHFRLKGVPSTAVKDCVQRYFNGDLMALYKHLYHGNPLTFNLLAGGGVSFKAKDTFNIQQLTEFNRTIQFPVDEEYVDSSEPMDIDPEYLMILDP